MLRAEGLEADEALLTGEAEPVAKQTGEQVLSGSFVVAGTGRVRATGIGAQAYAARLAVSAGIASQTPVPPERVGEGPVGTSGPNQVHQNPGKVRHEATHGAGGQRCEWSELAQVR